MLASGKSCHAAKGRLWCCWMKMHHCVPFLRPWHRSLTYWFGLFGAALILWCWIDSRYHRTHLSSGGKTGFGALNECSEIKIGIWLGSPFPYPRVFFVEKRDAEDFSWKSSFMVEHKELSSSGGDTVYILHAAAGMDLGRGGADVLSPETKAANTATSRPRGCRDPTNPRHHRVNRSQR